MKLASYQQMTTFNAKSSNITSTLNETKIELIIYKILIIILGGLLIISGIVNIILNLLIKIDNIFLVINIDIDFMIYGIIAFLSIFRIK